MSLPDKEIWTLGHSTHQTEVFLELLGSFAIELENTDYDFRNIGVIDDHSVI